MNFVDLHCHTTASDGTLSPTQLVARAREFGLKTIAVTDHDTTDGLGEALAAAAEAGLEVLPGIEINTDVPGGEIHVLGYFIDVNDQPFQAELRRLRDGRERRGAEITRRLAALGAPISWQRVQEIAGDAPIGRPHIARALLEAGHVNSMNEAFTLYIGRDGPAYVERMRFTPVEAVRAIKGVGGLPVLAHPIIARFSGDPVVEVNLDNTLPEMIAAGLVGLECYYPNYTQGQVQQLLAAARRFGLIATGGTDFHGPRADRAELGSIYVPERAVADLKAARQARASA